MPPIVIEGTLSIRVIWLLSGALLGENVLHANIGAGSVVDQAMANTIAGHLVSAHGTSGLNGIQPTSVTLDRVDIRDVRTPNQPLISGAVGSAGTSVAELLPRGNALVVTARTALAGKSFRGRTYIPGLDETTSGADGRAVPAATTATVAFLDDFNGLMTGSGWPLGVGSLFEAGVRRSPGIITNITGFVSRNGIFDRQWRRALR